MDLRRQMELTYRYRIDNIIIKLMAFFTRKMRLIDAIVIESHNDFDCNGGAFYSYLLENEVNKDYKIIWLTKNSNPNELPLNVKAYPLRKPSFMKNYYLCRARYILMDCEMLPKVRKDQVVVYQTHGSGIIKNVRGKMTVPGYVDYILSPSKRYDPIFADQMMTKDEQQFIHVGFPSEDFLFDEGIHPEVNKIINGFKKVVMWLPTFRKGGGYQRNDSTADLPLGVPLFHTIEEYNQLNQQLRKEETLLIVKTHPMQDLSVLRIGDLSNIKVLTAEETKRRGIDAYALIKAADGLISDYSAISFSYMHLNRPIAYVLDDENEYSIGFAVDNPHEFMPGKYIYSLDDFLDFIQDIKSNIDEFADRRNQVYNWMFEYHDGNSSARLAEILNIVSQRGKDD